MQEKLLITIYGLYNPIKKNIFYIGATQLNIQVRLNQHLHELRFVKTKKTDEIFSIIMSGDYVDIISLDKCELFPSEIANKEQEYIDTFLSKGVKLLQNTLSSYSIKTHNPLTRKNISINNKKTQDKIRNNFKEKELFELAYTELRLDTRTLIKYALEANGKKFIIYNSDKSRHILFPHNFFVKRTCKDINHEPLIFNNAQSH